MERGVQHIHFATWGINGAFMSDGRRERNGEEAPSEIAKMGMGTKMGINRSTTNVVSF